MGTRPAPQRRPVFLHSGWRSAGTWVWAQLRTLSDVLAFCEPLHESLASLREESLGESRPESWDSRHPQTRPYFEEYAPLLRERGGVAGFQRAFSFDTFFMDEHARSDQLATYLRELEALAQDASKVPVLKFARSHGRVGWMRRHFPHAVHAVIVRDPVEQWASGWRLAQQGTPYFLAAPIAILARSRGNTLVDRFVDALSPRVRALRSFTYGRTYRKSLQYVAESTPSELYRASLAFWVSTGLSAVPHADLILDSDTFSSEAHYRNAIGAALSSASGISVEFAGTGKPFGAIAHGLSRAEQEAAKAIALEACSALVRDTANPHIERAAALLCAKL